MEKLIKGAKNPKNPQSAVADMLKYFTGRGQSNLSPEERERNERRLEFRFDTAYAVLGVVFILFVLFVNYKLIGQYLSCLFFALISSMALRPTKDRFISIIQRSANGSHLFYESAAVLRFYPAVRDLVTMVQGTVKAIIQRIRGEKPEDVTLRHSFSQHLPIDQKVGGFFDDVNLLIYLTVCYVLLVRLNFELTLLLLVLFLFGDFAVRLAIDGGFLLSTKLCGRQFFLLKEDERRVTATIHQLVSSSLISLFLTLCFFLVVLGIILFFIDMQDLGEILVDQIPDDQDWFLGMLGFQNLSEFRLFVNRELNNLTVKVAQNFNVTHILLPVTPKNTTTQVFNQAMSVVNATLVSQMGPDSLLGPSPKASVVKDCETAYAESVPGFVVPALHYLCTLKYILLNADIEWGSLASMVGSSLLGAGVSIANIGRFFVKYLLNFLMTFGLALSDWIFYLLLYFTSIDFMLADQQSALNRISRSLPLSESTRKKVNQGVTQAVEGVFLSSFKIFIYHSVFTWLIFDLFGVRFTFTYAFICGVLTFIPLFAPALLCIPAALDIHIATGSVWSPILLCVIYFSVINKIETDLYSEEKLGLSSFWTGFAAVFGVTAFGLQGFFLGPLIFSLTTIVFSFIGESSSENEGDET